MATKFTSRIPGTQCCQQHNLGELVSGLFGLGVLKALVLTFLAYTLVIFSTWPTWYPEYGSQCSRKPIGTYWPDYIASHSTFHYVHSFTSFATIILPTENQVTQLSYTFPMPLQLHLFDWWKKRMCKHQKGVFSPFCSENVQCITTWLYKEWSWHFSLQVWTMTGKFIEQQVCFTWHHTARWNGGNSWVIIFMPFARVRVLAICCVMSWIGCARVIGHPI